jgi:uncharacterized membrane protein YccC
MTAPQRKIDPGYQAPPLSEWGQANIDRLTQPILNPLDFDAAVQEGVRRANDQLFCANRPAAPKKRAAPAGSSFAQGQERDRSAALMIAAFSLVLVAVIVSAIGIASHWPVLSYWFAK